MSSVGDDKLEVHVVGAITAYAHCPLPLPKAWLGREHFVGTRRQFLKGVVAGFISDGAARLKTVLGYSPDGPVFNGISRWISNHAIYCCGTKCNGFGSQQD